MVAMDLFTKHKNKILNLGVIILAIYIAFRIYGNQNKELDSLNGQKANEIKKNNVLESISQVEKRVVVYKQFFVKKELGEVIDFLSKFSKDTPGIQILSVKSSGPEEKRSEYLKNSYAVKIKVANYHALGVFISKLENYRDLYLVEDVVFNATNFEIYSGEILEVPATVSLKVSVISYL